jgi:hypothetical protein
MYAQVIEPWLGKYDQLKDIYRQFQRGTVSLEEGAARLRKHGTNQHTRGDCADAMSYKLGTAEHWKRRLRRDDPALAARVDAGELTANAAAVQKGWRKPRTKQSRFDQMVKWLPSLTEGQRAKLKEMLG